MIASTNLVNFFAREIDAEERSGFQRLSRVPDSRVQSQLNYYRLLSEVDRRAFLDCSAHWAAARLAFVSGAPQIDHRLHPSFERWREARSMVEPALRRSVPLLRAAVQQYKIDAYRGVPSHISSEEFEFASSIRFVKAPELRKRVRAALKQLGYYNLDELGYYRCQFEGHKFLVHADYRSRNAQLRYCVALPEFSDIHPLSQFSFESTLGFGFGHWDYIVEENVEDVFLLFIDLVRYCVALPDRIRAEVG